MQHRIAERGYTDGRNKYLQSSTYLSSRSDAYARTADFSFGLRDIESIGATCLHELLRRVPSVTVELGKCYVRGGTAVDGKRPAAIAIDGIFVNDDYDLDNIQMSDVERVDVFKGGSTVIWGAIGGMGVISITTKKRGFQSGFCATDKYEGFYYIRLSNSTKLHS